MCRKAARLTSVIMKGKFASCRCWLIFLQYVTSTRTELSVMVTLLVVSDL